MSDDDYTGQQDAIQRTQGRPAQNAMADQILELRERLATAERAIERLKNCVFLWDEEKK